MDADIAKAVSLLRAGGLVAFPTETVYGLGADATNASAIRRIFQAKERPFDHPLIVHLAALSQLEDWACDIPPDAYQLAKKFWPGPLTLVLKKQPHVLGLVTGEQETIGIRIPQHPVARALLEAFGGGIAAPSANRFTHISPTTAAAVREELQDKIDFILEGGACKVGLESTIIDLSSEQPVILRPGMISKAMLTAELGKPLLTQSGTSEIRVPGMHHLHYAPRTRTTLIASSVLLDQLNTLKEADLPIAYVTHSQINWPMKQQVHWLKMPNTPAAYAHDLYGVLRSLDHQQLKQIMIEMVPEESEWEAIRDRLLKAGTTYIRGDE